MTPPAPEPTTPPALPPIGPFVDNPFMKARWSHDDLLLVLVLAQVQSGRRGQDAVDGAINTLHAMEKAGGR